MTKTIERWPFIGQFHNKSVTFFGVHNGKSVIFSEGTFFVKFWGNEMPRKHHTREFTTFAEMKEFVES